MIAVVVLNDRTQVGVKCDSFTPPDFSSPYYTFFVDTGQAMKPVAFFQSSSVAGVVDSRNALLAEESE